MSKRSRARAASLEPQLPFDQPEVERAPPPVIAAKVQPPVPIATPAAPPLPSSAPAPTPVQAISPATERLTRLQMTALDLTGNRLISASAGTGKTHVLTALYLSLLEGRLSPGGKFLEDRGEWLRKFAAGEIEPLRASTVVAVTFTKKAAAELLDRARTDLEREIANPDLPPNLSRHLKACREELPGAPVSTIDAFCARLLREAGARSSAPPGFTILDDAEAVAMREAAFFDAATTLLEAPDHPNFKTLAREWGVLGSNGIRDSAISLFRALRSQGRAPGDLKHFAPPTWSVEQIRTALNEFIGAVKAMGGAYKLLKALKELCAGVRLTSAEEIHRATLTLSAAVPDSDWAKPLPTPFPEIITALHAPYAAELAGYVELAAERYASAKQREGCVDFDDLLFFARDLLTSENPIKLSYRFVLIDEYQDTNPLQDEVLKAVAAQSQSKIKNPKSKIISHAVVGDPKQSIYGFRGADVALIAGARRAMATSPLSESFRSRRALIEFFNEFFTELWPHPPASELFAGMRKPFVYDAGHKLEPGGEAPRHWVFGTIETSQTAGIAGEILSAGSADAGNADENRWHQALAIARRIRTLVQPREGSTLLRPRIWNKETASLSERIGYSDIAIFSRSIRHLRVPLQTALARMGVPFRMLGGISFYSRQEVLDVINLLAAVADPSDNLAVAGFLRSPFAGLSDANLWKLVMNEQGQPTRNLFTRLKELQQKGQSFPAFELLSELHAGLGRLTAAEIIDRACTATGYLSILAMQPQGEVAVAAVRRMIEVSRAFESRNAPHLSDFVRYLHEKADAEWNEPGDEGGPDLNDNLPAGSDAVQIGTIHSAKGLEFSIVILADVGAANPNRNARAIFHPAHGLGLGLRLGIEQEGLSSTRDSIYEGVFERQKWADEDERKRLLYVALTRAREYLIVSGESRSKTSWRSTFDDYCTKHAGRMAEVQYKHPELLAAAPDASGSMLDFQKFDPASDKPVAILRSASASAPTPAATPASGKLLQRNVTVTVSQLARWLSCPRREALDRWLVESRTEARGLRTEDDAPELDDDDDPDSRALGTAAHAALEAVFCDPEADLDAAWKTALTQNGLNSTHEACETTRKALANVVASSWGQRIRSLPSSQRLTEKPFRLKVAADAATGSTITLAGKLDLLAAVSDSAWQVVDYKLADRPERSAEPGETTLRYAWQTLLYAWVAGSILGKTIEPMLMFLRDPAPKPITLAELGFENLKPGVDFNPVFVAAWRSLTGRSELDRAREKWTPGVAKQTARTRDICSRERCPHVKHCFK